MYKLIIKKNGKLTSENDYEMLTFISLAETGVYEALIINLCFDWPDVVIGLFGIEHKELVDQNFFSENFQRFSTFSYHTLDSSSKSNRN